MRKPKFVVEAGPIRINVECDSCKDGMDTANNDFGQVLAVEFVKQHRCRAVARS